MFRYWRAMIWRFFSYLRFSKKEKKTSLALLCLFLKNHDKGAWQIQLQASKTWSLEARSLELEENYFAITYFHDFIFVSKIQVK